MNGVADTMALMRAIKPKFTIGALASNTDPTDRRKAGGAFPVTSRIASISSLLGAVGHPLTEAGS